jgi:hypothetical protein
MADFKFSCPKCDQHLQCDERLGGKQIQCPACNHLITIPPSPAQLAQGGYSPESGKTWATFVAPPQKPPKLNEPPPAQ